MGISLSREFNTLNERFPRSSKLNEFAALIKSSSHALNCLLFLNQNSGCCQGETGKPVQETVLEVFMFSQQNDELTFFKQVISR
jgi:hypothetical protein